MRKALSMIPLLFAALGAPYARADTITLDVSASLNPVSPATCSVCTLGGTLVINNTTGAFVSADLHMLAANPGVSIDTTAPIFPTTESTTTSSISSTLTFVFTSSPSAFFGLVTTDVLTIPLPASGSLVGYQGGPLSSFLDSTCCFLPTG
jgi:hypothetical protein